MANYCFHIKSSDCNNYQISRFCSRQDKFVGNIFVINIEKQTICFSNRTNKILEDLLSNLKLVAQIIHVKIRKNIVRKYNRKCTYTFSCGISIICKFNRIRIVCNNIIHYMLLVSNSCNIMT